MRPWAACGRAILLPWRGFVVETSWPPSVAVIEIRKQVGTNRGLLGGGGDNEYSPFVGTEDHGRFRISRRVGNQRSVRPRLEVAVEPSHHEGARIVGRLLPDPLILAATLGTCLLVGGMITAFGGLGVELLVGLPFAVLVAAALVVRVIEARACERLLREVFARAPALPAPPETDEAYR